MYEERLFRGFLIEFKGAFTVRHIIVTLKSSSDRDRPSGDAVGFSISNFSLGCRPFMVSWNSFAFSLLAV